MMVSNSRHFLKWSNMSNQQFWWACQRYVEYSTKRYWKGWLNWTIIRSSFPYQILPAMLNVHSQKPSSIPTEKLSLQAEVPSSPLCTKRKFCIRVRGSKSSLASFAASVLIDDSNMYVFPGIGLGSILCRAKHISQEMVSLSLLWRRLALMMIDIYFSYRIEFYDQHLRNQRRQTLSETRSYPRSQCDRCTWGHTSSSTPEPGWVGWIARYGRRTSWCIYQKEYVWPKSGWCELGRQQYWSTIAASQK